MLVDNKELQPYMGIIQKKGVEPLRAESQSPWLKQHHDEDFPRGLRSRNDRYRTLHPLAHLSSLRPAGQRAEYA